MKLKEKLFCNYYAKMQNHKEAAIKAKYDPKTAEKMGISLLANKDVKKYITKIIDDNKKDDFTHKSLIGLERLAFGSISDAIKLLFCDTLEDIEDITEMEFFNISEIKKVKGGGFEIKFFDRIKALEKIIEISQNLSESGTCDFFEAIGQSVSANSSPEQDSPIAITEEECNE